MRRRTKEKALDAIPIREILLDLWHAKPVLIKLKKVGKVYNPLIDLISIIEEDDPLPNCIELQARFNLTPAKFRKWVNELHTDYLHAISVNPEMLPLCKAKPVFLIKGKLRSISVACRLPFIPRVGEEIRIPFIKGTVGSYTFYVEKITYELYDSTFEIHIWLTSGSYNQHFESLKHRARFEKEIDFIEEETMSPNQLGHFLRDLYT